MKLLEFVLTNNYFKYDGHHYKQIFGCAMGSPISPVLADLVMEVIEETAIPKLFILPNGGFVMLTTVMRASKRIKSTRFTNIRTQSMLTFSSLWNLKTLTGMAYLSLTPSRPDAARLFKWRFTESQPIQTVTLIFSLITTRATKDQWLTRYSFVRENSLHK